MSDQNHDAIASRNDDDDAVEQVVDEVRDDIRHGQIEEDVSVVLEQRLEEAGLELRPEVVDDLAEDIENDVSL